MFHNFLVIEFTVFLFYQRFNINYECDHFIRCCCSFSTIIYNRGNNFTRHLIIDNIPPQPPVSININCVYKEVLQILGGDHEQNTMTQFNVILLLMLSSTYFAVVLNTPMFSLENQTSPGKQLIRTTSKIRAKIVSLF